MAKINVVAPKVNVDNNVDNVTPKNTTSKKVVAKKNEKKVVAKKSKKSTPKMTITSLVLRLFKNDPTIKGKAMVEEIKAEFPKSAFSIAHYSWFKYQIKNGKYNMPESVVEALKG